MEVELKKVKKGNTNQISLLGTGKVEVELKTVKTETPIRFHCYVQVMCCLLL